MPSVINPMADLYHSQLEASRRFADVLFSGTERIDHVVLEATHRAFTAQVNLAHAAVSMRDPKELATIQSTLLAQRPDNAVNFQKELVRVFAEIQNEMSKSMKDYLEKFGSNMTRSATGPMKNAQDKATDTVFNPMTGMFSMWESAFREVATMTNKNLSTARSVAEEVTHSAVHVNQNASEHVADAMQEAAAQAAGYVHEQGNGERPATAEKYPRNGNGGTVVHVEVKESHEERERRPHTSTSSARRK